MGRPLVEALREQQRQISIQAAQLAFLAEVAGISPQFRAIAARHTADINNPAQPWPDPPEQAPSETTQQAATAEAHDDPTVMGGTPGSTNGLAAETTDSPNNVGESLPTSPFGQQLDVTAPVSGTNTGEVPLPAVRTEVDVRVGNPDDPQPAFPWTIGSNRTMASMHLARLRIAAGLAQGDDLIVAATIEKDASISDEMLEHEAKVLGAVVQSRPRRTAARSGSVPRSANVQRVSPSLVPDSGSLSTTASAVDGDDSDLFL
jgi:hypothetical protein